MFRFRARQLVVSRHGISQLAGLGHHARHRGSTIRACNLLVTSSITSLEVRVARMSCGLDLAPDN
jgi:hypothetical protein